MKTRHKQLEREYKKAYECYPWVYWGINEMYPKSMINKLPRKLKKRLFGKRK